MLTGKFGFTPDQWCRILQAPLLVGCAVSAADPSGVIGALLEGMASARALAAAREDAHADQLMKAVAEDLLTPEGRSAARAGVQDLIQGMELAQIKTRALEELRGVAAILDSAAPLDSRPFKNWLNKLATSAAEAASEAGFPGFGGETVSRVERLTLDQISAALGT